MPKRKGCPENGNHLNLAGNLVFLKNIRRFFIVHRHRLGHDSCNPLNVFASDSFSESNYFYTAILKSFSPVLYGKEPIIYVACFTAFNYGQQARHAGAAEIIPRKACILDRFAALMSQGFERL